VGFVTPIVKNRVGFFSRYQPDVSTYTSRVFVSTGFLEGQTLFGATVDVYRSDWAHSSCFPILSDFTPTAYIGYFLDMDQPRLRTNGVWETRLAGSRRWPTQGTQMAVLGVSWRPPVATPRSQEPLNQERTKNLIVRPLTTNERAELPGFTHVIVITANDLTQATANTAQTF